MNVYLRHAGGGGFCCKMTGNYTNENEETIVRCVKKVWMVKIYFNIPLTNTLKSLFFYLNYFLLAEDTISETNYFLLLIYFNCTSQNGVKLDALWFFDKTVKMCSTCKWQLSGSFFIA